jgi:hypothetical protein
MDVSTLLWFLSAVFGWIYTAAWSLSFYPQPLLNRRRKSTSGTTIDFPFINSLGKEAQQLSPTHAHTALLAPEKPRTTHSPTPSPHG